MRNVWRGAVAALTGVAGVAGVLLLTACGGGPNSLGGSASELFPLEVSRVDVLRNEEALQVSYYRNRDADVDLVVRLSVALEGLELLPGQEIDLAGEYAPGHLRTTIIHLPGGEPARALPPVKAGDMVITRGGGIDEPTEGNFSVSFEQNGGYGSGRTLYGNFSGVAVDAGFGTP